MALQVTPIPFCPSRNSATYEKSWYRVPSIEGLDICSRCYADHIAKTPFAGCFVLDHSLAGSERSCDFNNPRMHAELARALQSNDFRPLRSYMQHRSQIKPCRHIFSMADGIKWWGVPSRPIEAFAVCEACYEDYIVPRGWAVHFRDSAQPQSGDSWMCSTWIGLGVRIAKNPAATLDQLDSLTTRFFELPACKRYEAYDPAQDTQTWYKMRPQDLAHIWICEACYLEWIAASPLDPHVFAVGRQNTGGPLKCTVGSVLSFKLAVNWGVVRQDFNVFYRAAQTIARSPPCVAEGMGPEAGWMTLSPQCEFGVCGACFAAFIEAPGFPDRYGRFVRAYLPPGTMWICNFNPQAIGGKRSAQFFRLLDEAVDSGDPDKFTEPARVLADAPACPGAQPQGGQVWYLNNTYACCPECWVLLVRGTALDRAAFPQQRNARVGAEVALKCDFWSPRVRGRWQEAVASNDLTAFDGFMQERLQVFGKTWPEINNLRSMMKNQFALQMNMYQNSVVMSCAGSFSAVAGGDGGSWGNSTIGYHPTMSGAEGALMFNQASRMNMDNGPTLQRIAELEILWKAVE